MGGEGVTTIDPEEEARRAIAEKTEIGGPGCSKRAHAERTMWDTTAGIRVTYGPHVTPTFMVHCLECHSDFGPYQALAIAQEVGRYCGPCDRSRRRRLDAPGKEGR